ncbi:MAG: hypothetical protein E7241_02315 [Lachnospiraceae bacterium]|nr:hypothetical protein [Lachnospiraceae bacterium]
MEERYIFKNIKSYYLKHTLIPLIVLAFSVFLTISFKLTDVLFPEVVRNGAEISEKNEYVDIVIDEIYPAGYQMISGNSIMGNYYYGFYNGRCLYVLLPLSEYDGEPSMKNYHMFGKLSYTGNSLTNITSKISSDLNWSSRSLSNSSYPYVISNIGTHLLLDRLIAIMILLTIFGSAIIIIYDFISAFIPTLSPPGRGLAKYGKAKDLLLQADDELSTLPQLATEDMFITEHFFIEVSTYGIAIVPINQIVWIYKHSTLHKLFNFHISMSYTLHISAHRQFYFNCPKNTKTDIDGIIDYLAEANHSIIVGFSPENKALAKERTANDPGIRTFFRNNA